MELSPGEGCWWGEGSALAVWARLGKGSSLGAAPPASRGVDINTGAQGERGGREKRGCFPICTAPHHRGGGEQGEE